MHCELVIPGLLPATPQTIDAVRLPALELLLARARRSPAEPAPLEAWLQKAFEAGRLASGALTALAANAEPGAHSWVRADPVHLKLMRDRLLLVPAQALDIAREESDALCASINRHFAGTLQIAALDPRRWYARLDREIRVNNQADALELAGGESTPEHDSDPLLTEMQMLLHSHPVNEAREVRGEPAINSLWLWGAGSLPTAKSRWRSVQADEPIALGLARRAGTRHRALPAAASAALDGAPEEGRHLVVLDALRAPLALSQNERYRECLAAYERDWFAPLLQALRANRLGMLTIRVPDGEAAAQFEIVRGDLRRFWRRPRPLASRT